MTALTVTLGLNTSPALRSCKQLGDRLKSSAVTKQLQDSVSKAGRQITFLAGYQTLADTIAATPRDTGKLRASERSSPMTQQGDEYQVTLTASAMTANNKYDYASFTDAGTHSAGLVKASTRLNPIPGRGPVFLIPGIGYRKSFMHKPIPGTNWFGSRNDPDNVVMRLRWQKNLEAAKASVKL